MKIALIGLSNSGKTTLFNALTGLNIEPTIYPTISGEPNIGVVKVPDPEIDRLSEIYRPKKITYATIEYVDYIGLTKGDLKQNRKVFDLIKDVDAIVHVVRAFYDESVVHPMASINPVRDIDTVELELVFGDLELVEKRLERMKEGKKRGKKPDETEQKLLQKCRDFLMKETPLRNVEFTKEEIKAMRPLQFLSTIPKVIVLNTGERDDDSEYANTLESSLLNRYPSANVLTLCGKIEMEISQLPEDEKESFFCELGIEDPVSNRLIRTCYQILGLISFLTVGEDEVRAWTVRSDTNALTAAGKIHSDIERGFIRAEVISYEDFISSGSMHTARVKGLLRLEGKTYEVRDGDIINFRFNV
ncbi:MAG: redox-regulated ATPase YchF [Nitrospirae bacterium RBG_13_39_12]|nr:MAG: redox-regulated ATPase YchF [Nitrospirae bacterium RBG_13_39_12]